MFPAFTTHGKLQANTSSYFRKPQNINSLGEGYTRIQNVLE